jgi:hypothetical protein
VRIKQRENNKPSQAPLETAPRSCSSD